MGRQLAIAVALLFALGVLVAAMAWSTAARGQEPAQQTEDVLRVERAVKELAPAKRGAAGQAAANKRAAAKALSSCETDGPGWKAIRAVGVPAQRSLYRRGARTLWKALGEVAAERAAFDAYRPLFERFVRRFDAPLDDPLLQAGADAWRKRIALYEAYTPIGTCRRFNKLAKRAREFPPNVEADYKSGDIYSRMVRFVEDTKRTAARRHWGSRYDAALRAARDRLIELGGNEGYATFFSFGHSLRG
ncbi:MAG: hypothetical protein QOD71_1029 [Thermoleophilaceae bacterium]|nr:hypothetical protein [Thermoleophilaceae bacterium]